MRLKLEKSRIAHDQGFTLVELTVVMVIGVIIFSGTIFLYKGYIEKAIRQTCNANCVQFEGMYHSHLLMENKEHTAYEFKDYLQKCGGSICPTNGEIKYANGMVRCNLHFKDKTNGTDDGGDNGSVPYL